MPDHDSPQPPPGVDGSAYFNRSGPRMVDGVEILGALLHPELFPEVELDERAEVWYPVTK